MLYRLLLFSVASMFVATVAIAQKPLPAFTAADRIVIVAPHPDDEALATGGLIQNAVAVGADVRIIYLTNGDHNQIAFKLYSGALFMSAKRYQGFGEKRFDEAVAATRRLGLTSDRLSFLGYPDWGLIQMWRDCWEDPEPFRSDATRANAVPYPKDYGYRHPYKPEGIVADLKALFDKFHPTIIFTTHPCDTNPDHRATANFVRLALLDMEGVGGCAPRQYYYVIHFGDWPKPYHYHPEVQMTVPARLLDDGDWFTMPLTPEQTEKKHNAILDNHSQLTTRQFYLDAFARANELYATLPKEYITNVPVELQLDWKQAVRNRTLKIDTRQRRQPLVNNLNRERNVFVSLEQTAFLRQGDALLVAVDFANRFGPRSNFHLFLYGYRRGTSFATLPKMHINVNPFGNLHVYDDDRRQIHDHGVTKISISGDKLILRIPMHLLGGNNLDHLFTATRANLGEISADDTAWQLYEFQPTEESHG